MKTEGEKSFDNQSNAVSKEVLVRHVFPIEAEDFSSAGEVSRKLRICSNSLEWMQNW